MADSSYYKEKYKAKRKEAKDYEDNIEDLEEIENRLRDEFYDDAREVNDEIDDLVEDARTAIRHSAEFTANVNALTGKKQKGVTADSYLNAAIDEIAQEISRLKGLKEDAEDKRDYYKRKYEEKKEEERKAFWDSLF